MRSTAASTTRPATAGIGSNSTALKNSQGATVAYVANNPNAQYIKAGLGTFPNVGRNSIATPWQNNWDFAILKRINITERQSVEFQFSATNIFNHAQYVPGLITDVQSFGQAGTNHRNMLIPTHPTSSSGIRRSRTIRVTLSSLLKYNF